MIEYYIQQVPASPHIQSLSLIPLYFIYYSVSFGQCNVDINDIDLTRVSDRMNIKKGMRVSTKNHFQTTSSHYINILLYNPLGHAERSRTRKPPFQAIIEQPLLLASTRRSNIQAEDAIATDGSGLVTQIFHLAVVRQHLTLPAQGLATGLNQGPWVAHEKHREKCCHCFLPLAVTSSHQLYLHQIPCFQRTSWQQCPQGQEATVTIEFLEKGKYNCSQERALLSTTLPPKDCFLEYRFTGRKLVKRLNDVKEKGYQEVQDSPF